MTLEELRAARILVVGLGKSGLAATELLRANRILPQVTDCRALAELPEVAARLDALGVSFRSQTPEVFENRDLIVISPGVPADLPELDTARTAGAFVVGELELASWFLRGNVIGITGSNGKTTTTALAGHVLERSGVPAQVGGNIGNPPSNMVATSRAEQWNVLELSSFQLETIERFRAHIGVVLNVTPDHLDRHPTMETYATAKQRIFENQQTGDWAVLNADDGTCRRFGRTTKSPPVWFSVKRPVDRGLWIDSGKVLYDGAALIGWREIPLRGWHNVENVMAASAAARLAGAPLEAIAAAVRTFPGVEHRLEYVATIGGVEYFNDSKATNVDAALKALEAFERGLWVILGGKDKGSDYRALRDPLERKAREALLIGAAAAKIANHLGGTVATRNCRTLEEAVREASRRAQPGDTVLLAPACASFDQFSSFEHRGSVFKQLVEQLAPGDQTETEEGTTCA